MYLHMLNCLFAIVCMPMEGLRLSTLITSQTVTVVLPCFSGQYHNSSLLKYIEVPYKKPWIHSIMMILPIWYYGTNMVNIKVAEW